MGVYLRNFIGYGWLIKSDFDRYLDYFDEDELNSEEFGYFIHTLGDGQYLFLGYGVADYEPEEENQAFSFEQMDKILEYRFHINWDWEEYFGECLKPAEDPKFHTVSYWG